MALSAGSLRHYVRIQRPETLQDQVTGEQLVTWVDVANTFADIVPLSMREFIAAGAEQSEVSARIVIRRRPDIDATMRVVHRGMAYAIKGVMADPISGLEYQTLAVGEGVRVT